MTSTLPTSMRSSLLFSFVALLVVTSWAHWLLPLLGLGLALLSLASLVVMPRELHQERLWVRLRLDRDDLLWVVMLLAYGGLWLLDVWRSGQWPFDSTGWSIPLPFWPLLAAALLIWLLRYPPAARVFWVAVCCGALGAGAIALYERLVLGKLRADNELNPIAFGNLSLLLGGLSLLAFLWCMRRGHARSPGLAALALLAGLSGIMASLLSGTRGGWIALPLLLLFWFRTSQGLLPATWRYGTVASLTGLFVIAILLPSTNVMPRVTGAVAEAQQFQAGEARGSVGLRLEMWRGGMMLWRERPLIGWGEKGVIKEFHALIDRGEISARVHGFHQLHSDVIDTAARRGLLGVTTLLMLYGVPLWLFGRRLGPSSSTETQLVAGAGMMICVAFIDFGLSQSMLRDPVGLSGYLGLCLACWAALKASERA